MVPGWADPQAKRPSGTKLGIEAATRETNARATRSVVAMAPATVSRRLPRVLGIVLGSILAAAGSAGAQTTLIGNVTVVSAERAEPLRGAWVSIVDGRIAAVDTTRPADPAPRDARFIDGTNLYLTPGLIDSHVHLAAVAGMAGPQRQAHPELVRAYRAQLPRSYLYFGYTTVVDLSAEDPRLIESLRAAPNHPDIRTCGSGLPLANGFRMSEDPPESRFDDHANWLYDRYQAQEVPPRYDLAEHSPEAVVGKALAEGGICVKTYYENGFGGTTPVTWDMPSVTIIRDVVEAAHRQGIPVLVHANSYASHRFAAEAGVDIIAHGMWHWGDVADFLEVDELPATHHDLLVDIAARRIGYQPTIQVLMSQRALFDTGYLDDRELRHALPAAHLEWLRSPQGAWHREWLVAQFSDVLGAKGDHQLYALFDRFARKTETVTRLLAGHGARLLFGTDTPSGPAWGNPPGYNGYLEMLAWVDSGVSLRQLFEAATLENARAFHLEADVGSIEVGKRADLLLLERDPLQSVEAWNAIRLVIRAGDVVPRSALSATAFD
jgi:imidazolonepropionase-like amidohydrolase